MPDGRNNSVEVLVATIPALLVMKGYALTGRDKKKDAYDIYYSVRNFPGGPEELARECRALLENDIAREGFARVAGKFGIAHDFGPQTVRAFLEESAALGDMTPEQVQEDAFRQVRAFLAALGFAK
jgi:predicted nucleotidyltransferase